MQEITLEELKEQLKALPRSERLQRLRELISVEWRGLNNESHNPERIR